MSAPIISGDNAMLLFGLFAGTILCGVVMEKRGPLKGLPAPAFIFITAALATQVSILPREAGFYDLIWRYMVPLGIAIFLIRADLIEIVTRGGRILIGFIIGSVGIVIGTMLATTVLDMGPEEAKLAGVFSAAYIGGLMNFAAVSEAVEFDDRSLLASALAVDNIMGTLCMLVMMYVGSRQYLKNAFPWRSETLAVETPASTRLERPTTLTDILSILALAALVCAGADALMRTLGSPAYTMLAITAIMVMIGTFAKNYLANIRGEDVLAMICMYMFIAMVGTGIDLQALTSAAPKLFLMVLIIFAVHMLMLFGAGYLLKLNYAELVIASLACITGPPVIAALAISFRWNSLLAPGVLAGILGYAIGNFIGVAIFFYLS